MEGSRQVNEWLPLLTAMIGVGTGATGSYVALRKDQRETRSQVLLEANQTIDLLKDQNSLLREQLTASEERERKLEKRVSELERDYRTLVKTISTMGLCKDPVNCPAYQTINLP
jgi:uncharacterized membrane protein YgaE (UPF0421/DUF939 family)